MIGLARQKSEDRSRRSRHYGLLARTGDRLGALSRLGVEIDREYLDVSVTVVQKLTGTRAFAIRVIADAVLIFNHFLSGLAWIHNLQVYLKACGPGPGQPGQAVARPAEGPLLPATGSD